MIPQCTKRIIDAAKNEELTVVWALEKEVKQHLTLLANEVIEKEVEHHLPRLATQMIPLTASVRCAEDDRSIQALIQIIVKFLVSEAFRNVHSQEASVIRGVVKIVTARFCLEIVRRLQQLQTPPPGLAPPPGLEDFSPALEGVKSFFGLLRRLFPSVFTGL